MKIRLPKITINDKDPDTCNEEWSHCHYFRQNDWTDNAKTSKGKPGCVLFLKDNKPTDLETKNIKVECTDYRGPYNYDAPRRCERCQELFGGW
jgi:hypothetical protein